MSLNKFSRPKGLTESQAVQKKIQQGLQSVQESFSLFFCLVISYIWFGLEFTTISTIADRQIYSFLELQEEKLYFKEGEGKNMNY